MAKPSKDWKPIDDQQYQLDVGQKEFGLRTCPQCDMQYSVHEPQDEILHMEYHNRVRILTFKGWNNERVVTQISEWNPPGRIIYVCELDSKAKKDRVKEVLTMVDRDLGFATGAEMKPKTLVGFLADFRSFFGNLGQQKYSFHFFGNFPFVVAGLFSNCEGANCWHLCGTTVGTCTSHENRKWHRLLYDRNVSCQVSTLIGPKFTNQIHFRLNNVLFLLFFNQMRHITHMGCSTVSSSWHRRQIDYINAWTFHIRCIPVIR